MKNFLFPLFAILIAVGTVSAQISITEQDMPGPGDTIRISLADDNLVSTPANTGANYSWDYRNLVPDTTYLHTFQDPDDSPSFIFRLSFFDATMMDVGEANGLLLFTGMDPTVFPFYKTDNSSFEYMGYGAYIDSFPSPVIFSDPDRIYPLPMNFGTQDQSLGRYVLDIPTVAYYRQEIERTTEVDGWGTLQLPGGFYSVLRVYSEVVTQDSLFLDSIGFGFNLPPNTTYEYKWLANGYPAPVLEVHETRGFGGPGGGGQFRVSYVAYRNGLGNATSIGEAPSTELPHVSVFPNPSEGGFVHVEVPGMGKVWIRVLDVMGREVSRHSEETGSLVLDTGTLVPGIYTLEIINAAGRFSQKLVIE